MMIIETSDSGLPPESGTSAGVRDSRPPAAGSDPVPASTVRSARLAVPRAAGPPPSRKFD
eukprot:206499-Hanusia_phi.AAC.1